MRISLRLATIVTSLMVVCALTHPAYSQNNNSGTTVVVLDVGRVFKEHNRFKQRMEAMKKDVEAFEGYLRAEREKIQKMAEELKNFKNGSTDYNNREAQIAKITSTLQVETQLKRKEFMQQEAKLYYNTYTEVTEQVARLAREWGVHLVLRYNSEKIKPDDRASVLAGVNANVVYQSDRDITNAIITAVNQGGVLNGGSGTSDLRNRPQIPQRK